MKERAEVASRSVRSVRDGAGSGLFEYFARAASRERTPPYPHPPSPRRSRRETALNLESRISDHTNALATR